MAPIGFIFAFTWTLCMLCADSASTRHCQLPKGLLEEIKSYQPKVNTIINAFTKGELKGRTYDLLANLTDTFGHRQAGFESLENAIDWVVEKSEKQKFDKVYTEEVVLPKWVRNEESLSMVKPRFQDLPLLGLGTTIGTKPEGIYAEAIVVASFDELNKISDKVAGKIVVFNAPYISYGVTAEYRVTGAAAAAKHGAIAALVRSVTPFSLGTPHTGGMNYEEGITKIPGASITVEDATMLHRIQQSGEKIFLNLTMGAENVGDFTSRNTIVEMTGTEKPKEISVVSGHLDSWDVGTGAMDDGGGCVVSLMAVTALKELKMPVKRTVRAVLFTGEELGYYGGLEYHRRHAKETFQLLLESDFGTFNPQGIHISGNEMTTCIMEQIVSLLKPVNATQLSSPSEVPDLGGFKEDGVPTGSLMSDNEKYLWYHHSEGDRMEFVDSDTLDRVSAVWASVAYVVSDLSILLPR